MNDAMQYGSEGLQFENRLISYKPETRPPRFREECLYFGDNTTCSMARRCAQTDRIGDCRLPSVKYVNNALSRGALNITEGVSL